MISYDLRELTGSVKNYLNEIMSNIGGDKVSLTQYQFLANMIFGRSVTSFYATEKLCEGGYGLDAMTVVRSIVENMITLEYISIDPDNRTRLYWDFIHVLKYKRLKQIYGDVKPETLSDREKVICSNYNRVKDQYPNKINWSGKTIRGMVDEMFKDKPWLMTYYQLPYVIGSSYVHGNIEALYSYVNDIDHGIRILSGPPSQEGTDKSLMTAINIIIVISQTFCNIMDCELPANSQDLIDEANSLFRRL